MRHRRRALFALLFTTIADALTGGAATAQDLDLVITGGRVMDPASGLDAVRDVGVRDGRVVAAERIPPLGPRHDRRARAGGGSGLHRSARPRSGPGFQRVPGRRRCHHRARVRDRRLAGGALDRVAPRAGGRQLRRHRRAHGGAHQGDRRHRRAAEVVAERRGPRAVREAGSHSGLEPSRRHRRRDRPDRRAAAPGPRRRGARLRLRSRLHAGRQPTARSSACSRWPPSAACRCSRTCARKRISRIAPRSPRCRK